MKIVVTGGTFMKQYCPRKGTMEFNNVDYLKELLSRLHLNYEAEIVQWQLKDSREFDTKDREQLYRFLFPIRKHPIVVVHGTDTLEYTAGHFARENAWGGKIVFTAAWYPLSYKGTDAEFNLGFAIACAQIKPPGVYVAMNGQCFDADNVRKNWGDMRFEATFQPFE